MKKYVYLLTFTDSSKDYDTVCAFLNKEDARAKMNELLEQNGYNRDKLEKAVDWLEVDPNKVDEEGRDTHVDSFIPMDNDDLVITLEKIILHE